MKHHLDEHVNNAVAIGLRRRGMDVTTTAEADLIGASDQLQLEYAKAGGRVVFTQDQDFLALGPKLSRHAGITYCKQGSRTIGQIIEHLERIHICVLPFEMVDHIEFY